MPLLNMSANRSKAHIPERRAKCLLMTQSGLPGFEPINGPITNSVMLERSR